MQYSQKPKVGSTHRGATWDTIPVVLPDGTVVKGYVDTTWGAYIHFEIGPERWRKVRVGRANWGLWILDLRAQGR